MDEIFSIIFQTQFQCVAASRHGREVFFLPVDGMPSAVESAPDGAALQSVAKKISIKHWVLIEKLGLSWRWRRLTLPLSDSSDITGRTSPASPEAITCLHRTARRRICFLCEARWHGHHARHQPRPVQLAGVFSWPMAGVRKEALQQLGAGLGVFRVAGLWAPPEAKYKARTELSWAAP